MVIGGAVGGRERLYLGVPQSGIRACFGSKCSGVRIPPSRHRCRVRMVRSLAATQFMQVRLLSASQWFHSLVGKIPDL